MKYWESYSFIWNPSIYECECDKLCDVGEYLDHENCKCKTRLTDKLLHECSEDINGNEMVYNVTLNDHGRVRNSCTINTVFIIAIIIITGICSI